MGTTFRIYLPMIEGSDFDQSTTETTPPPKGTETILIADDDEGVCRIAEAILRWAGYTVLKARDGEEAIRIFEERSSDIDLALLDIVMPLFSGKAVYDYLQEKGIDIPVLFASGYSTEGIHSDFVLEEGMHLIQKPYHRDALLRKIRQLLDS